jgi:hypothetical protein
VARRECDVENLVNEETIARVGLQSHAKKSYKYKTLRFSVEPCSTHVYVCDYYIRNVIKKNKFEEAELYV